MMSVLYTYPPLAQPRQIRLLKVRIDRKAGETPRGRIPSSKRSVSQEHPRSKMIIDSVRKQQLTQAFSKSAEEPIINVQFVVTSLDNPCTTYTAISYVWGSPEQTQQVRIDGTACYLEIPASTMSVLAHLVQYNVAEYIWIDALCINQHDTREKSQQVCYMYDIYRKADRVLVSAGEPYDHSDLAIDFIGTIESQIRRLDREKAPLTEKKLTRSTGCHFPSPQWTALARFFCRPLFRRIWIVQEIIAARSKRVLCGSSEIDWTRLSYVTTRLISSGCGILLNLPTKTELNAAGSGAEALSLLFEVYIAARNSQPSRLPFSYVLSTSGNLSSTDPRDRIFALRNISDVAEHELVPDYNKSVETVYRETAVHLMSKNGLELSSLYAAGIGHRRKLIELPSWVPDWSESTGVSCFGDTADRTIFFEPRKDLFYACGKDYTLEAKPEYLGSSSVRYKGRILDRIRSYHGSRPQIVAGTSTEIVEKNHATISTWLASLCKFLEPNYPYPSSNAYAVPDVLSETLVAGDMYRMSSDSRTASHDFIDYFAQLFISSYKFHSGVNRLVPDAVKIRSLQLACLNDSSCSARLASEAAQRYDHSVKKNRRLFITEEKYIGLGPLLMQEDDIVCLLYGAKVPFLIRRRNEGGYQLVGECYVHGLMHGEGMTLGEEQDIVLH